MGAVTAGLSLLMPYFTAKENQGKSTGLHWHIVPSETLTETLKLLLLQLGGAWALYLPRLLQNCCVGMMYYFSPDILKEPTGADQGMEPLLPKEP